MRGTLQLEEAMAEKETPIDEWPLNKEGDKKMPPNCAPAEIKSSSLRFAQVNPTFVAVIPLVSLVKTNLPVKFCITFTLHAPSCHHLRRMGSPFATNEESKYNSLHHVQILTCLVLYRMAEWWATNNRMAIVCAILLVGTPTTNRLMLIHHHITNSTQH